MSPRTRRELRKYLIDKLGGKCSRCPETEYLQMDCIKPVGPAHHRMFSDRRYMFYLSQLQAGNLQLLCLPCHTNKTREDVHAKRGFRVRYASECHVKQSAKNT
jgi:hypothetical protein